MLVILSGRPGVGKSSVGRRLAKTLQAAYLRVDTIEAGLAQSSLAIDPAADAGYTVAYGLAGDNLALGRSVVADSVNPIALTRDAWHAVARAASVPHLDLEIVCSDEREHRRRVEERRAAEGPTRPDWAAVTAREFQTWSSPRLVIDTAGRSPDDCAAEIIARLWAGSTMG